MQVFLTGGTGYIGSYVLRELLAEGHRVRCLTRRAEIEEDRWELDPERIETVSGDVTDPASLEGAADGCDAAIHLVGIIEERPREGLTFEAVHAEGTRNVVEEARRCGLDTFVHMSANGARPDGASRYEVTKWEAEDHVRSAGFDHWTIFRPSIVFGKPGSGQPEFASELTETLIRPFPVWPVFGSGNYEVQPVHVEPLAEAFVAALTLPAAAGSTYCAAGRRRLTFEETLDVIARGIGIEPRPKVHVPLWMAWPVIGTVGWTGLLPISSDQLAMLVEGNTCDPTAFYGDFGVEERAFEPEALSYLQADGS